MKITYDKEADALYIKLSDQPIVESEELEQHVVADYDENNQIVGVEILYFIEKHRSELFPAFKAMEAAVWQQEYNKVG